MMAAATMASALTYPPYEYYTGTTSGTPALNYTKVCEPGRSGEANATYVVLGHCYPSRFPSYTAKFGSDFTASLTKPTGKKDAAGHDLQVWQDYVAGTDPTDVNDVFRAAITMNGGTPVVSWMPVLSATEAAKRTYTILGRQSLLTGDWTVVPSGQEADYNFFKVRVEMK